MSNTNFSLTKPLEKKINHVIKKYGFASKAEFFRFAAMNYIQAVDQPNDISDAEYTAAINDLKNAIHEKFKNKVLPSLEEQFADLR